MGDNEKQTIVQETSLSMCGGKDYSISIIRFLSLLLIISCHICQYYEMELAYWLNVGVQIFLCISGYLFGNRKKNSGVLEFYKKRFLKILIPFYIVLLCCCLIHFVFLKDLSFLTFAQLLIMKTTISGLGHLWFVPTILFCYVITPLLQDVYELEFIKGKFTFLFVTVLSVIIIAIFCVGFANAYHPAWLGCYIIGFALGINDKKRFFSNFSLICIFFCLAIMNVLQIYIDYFNNTVIPSSLSPIYILWTRYNHVWLGVFIFLIVKTIFNHVQLENQKILNVTDEFSYETYLVHQIFLLGPFSLLSITSNRILNIICAIICIVFSSFVLKFFEKVFMNLLKNKKE